MQVTIELPEDVAAGLIANNGADLPRAVLENFASEGYRSGTLTHAQVGRILGFDHPLDVEAFLKDHGVYLEYSLADLELDRSTHQSLGL